VPPYKASMVKMACRKSLGNFFHGTMVASLPHPLIPSPDGSTAPSGEGAGGGVVLSPFASPGFGPSVLSSL
jgi:hypothetical protein